MGLLRDPFMVAEELIRVRDIEREHFAANREVPQVTRSAVHDLNAEWDQIKRIMARTGAIKYNQFRATH